MPKRTLVLTLAAVGVSVALALAVAGCTRHTTPPEATQQLQAAEQQTYSVPPKELYQVVKQVVTSPPLSLPIEQEQHGVIQTGYKEGYRGDFHIARYWQERTRFRIAVVPDWNEPTAKSRLEVSEETQARSNPQAPYADDPEIKRPERSAEIIRLVQERLGKAQ